MAGAWVAFGAFWVKVGLETPLSLAVQTAVGLAVTLAVSVAVTSWWVRHNLAIYRRRGPRKQVPQATMAFVEDFLGRRLDADWDRLRDAPTITVTIDGGRKVYRPQEPETAGGEATESAR